MSLFEMTGLQGLRKIKSVSRQMYSIMLLRQMASHLDSANAKFLVNNTDLVPVAKIKQRDVVMLTAQTLIWWSAMSNDRALKVVDGS
jgi:hypothetical protein